MTAPGAILARTARPPKARRLPQCLVMLLLCGCGMMAGLAIDLRTLSPDVVVALCSTAPSLATSVALHATLLPVTGFLTVAAAVLAVWRRPADSSVVFELGCSAAMLVAMALSGWAGPRLAAAIGHAWTLADMVAAMAVGMALGAGAWLMCHQAWAAFRRY